VYNRKKRLLRKKCKKEVFGYDPNNPLTLHYIRTGAILPSTPKKISNIKTKIND